MFFFPLFDDNPTHRHPLITWLILAACVLVFLWQASLPFEAARDFIGAYGFTPRLFFEQREMLPLFSSMFMHGGWAHLLGNMLYLYIFADNIEDSMGKGRFIIFYSLCGIAAALTQGLIDPASEIPMVGASGAIAGVLGGYLMLHPRANIRCLIGIFIFFRVMNIPAFIVLGGWIMLQFVNLGQFDSETGGVAYFAHIGGFIAGMVLIPFFKKAHIPLFAKARSRAFAMQPVAGASGHVPITRKRKEENPPENPWSKDPWTDGG